MQIFEDYLLKQNIQWQGKRFQASTRREALNRVISFLPMDHAIAVTGIRRCGKSYLLKQVINHLLEEQVKPENILFINLEAPPFSGKPAHEILDPLYELYLKLKNPIGRQYIFLDEVQNLDRWETWIKYHYDQNKGKLKFILTGSNSHMLSSEFASLLTGRVLELALFPFSFREFLFHHECAPRDRQSFIEQKSVIMKLLDDYIRYGGMPELPAIEDVEAKRQLLISYFDAILYKDIIPRFAIRDRGLLNDLAVYLLGATAELVNISKLATRFKANRSTIREFIEYLEKAFLFIILCKFSFSPRARLDSFKKCHALDTGFANLLPIRFSPDSGKLLETLICVELQRRFDHIFYWRNRHECDFVVQNRDGARQAVQVCYQLTLANWQREVEGLTEAAMLFNTQSSIILTVDQEPEIKAPAAGIEIRSVAEWLSFPPTI